MSTEPVFSGQRVREIHAQQTQLATRRRQLEAEIVQAQSDLDGSVRRDDDDAAAEAQQRAASKRAALERLAVREQQLAAELPEAGKQDAAARLVEMDQEAATDQQEAQRLVEQLTGLVDQLEAATGQLDALQARGEARSQAGIRLETLIGRPSRGRGLRINTSALGGRLVKLARKLHAPSWS